MKLLYLTHRCPYPPDRGDRLRSFNLLKFLAARCEVHLACLADEPVDPQHRQVLGRLCRRLAIVPVARRWRWCQAAASLARGRSATEGLFYSPGMCQVLGQWARQVRYDAALAFCSSMTPYLRLPGLADVPAVVDLVDVDSQKWADYAQASRAARRWLYQLEAGRVRQLEQQAVQRASAITLVSQHEVDLLHRFAPQAAARAVGNGVDLDYFGQYTEAALVDQTSFRLVFVGVLDYPPNVQACDWFCRHVWPRLLADIPQARLQLVGRHPAAAVRQLARLPGVEVVGSVPDVRPYLAAAAVSIAPLQIARGIQNKVLESMAAGRPVVASPKALEGIELTTGLHALEACTPDQWHATLLRLHRDPALRQALGHAVRQFVEQHYAWPQCLAPLENLLNLVPARPEPCLQP